MDPTSGVNLVPFTTDGTDFRADGLSLRMAFRKNAPVACKGYKLLFNVEKGGGQEIFHLHLHLIGGW